MTLEDEVHVMLLCELAAQLNPIVLHALHGGAEQPGEFSWVGSHNENSLPAIDRIQTLAQGVDAVGIQN
jgi:hypothetical protein